MQERIKGSIILPTLFPFAIRNVEAPGEALHQFVFVEKLAQDDPQHGVAGNGEYHSWNSCQVPRNQQNEENLQRVRIDTVSVNQRLQHDIVYQLRDAKNDGHVNQHGKKHRVEIHVDMRDQTDKQAKHRPENRPEVRDDIGDSCNQPDNHRMDKSHAHDRQPDNVQRHHDNHLQRDSDEVTHQQALNRVQGVGDSFLVTGGSYRYHHPIEKLAVFQKEKGHDILKAIGDDALRNLNWYFRLNPKQFASVAEDLNTNLYVLQEIINITKEQDPELMNQYKEEFDNFRMALSSLQPKE